MPLHGVKALLLLPDDTGAAHHHAVAGLGDRPGLHSQVQVLAGGQHLRQLLVVGFCVACGTAADILHVAGTGLAPVLIVAVGPEGQPHGLDIVENFARLHRLGHLYAEAGVVAKAPGAVHVEFPVRPGHEAQVPVGGVGHVGGGVGEAHLQLPGHLLRLDEVHEVVPGGLGPGQNVEILALLHAGEGRAHHVPGEVSAAAHGDDARVQGFFHDVADIVLLQIVELNGLAGGEMGPGHGMLPDGPGGERQLFLRHPSGGHPQAQHAGLAAFLGIAAVQPGKTLIGGFVQLSGVKRGGFCPKFRQVLFPALRIDGMHRSVSSLSLRIFLCGHCAVYREIFYHTLFSRATHARKNGLSQNSNRF